MTCLTQRRYAMLKGCDFQCAPGWSASPLLLATSGVGRSHRLDLFSVVCHRRHQRWEHRSSGYWSVRKGRSPEDPRSAEAPHRFRRLLGRSSSAKCVGSASSNAPHTATSRCHMAFHRAANPVLPTDSALTRTAARSSAQATRRAAPAPAPPAAPRPAEPPARPRTSRRRSR